MVGDQCDGLELHSLCSFKVLFTTLPGQGTSFCQAGEVYCYLSSLLSRLGSLLKAIHPFECQGCLAYYNKLDLPVHYKWVTMIPTHQEGHFPCDISPCRCRRAHEGLHPFVSFLPAVCLQMPPITRYAPRLNTPTPVIAYN